MRAIISVVGKDHVGILAAIANQCQKYDANIVDVSQTVLQEFFTMIMLVEMDNSQFLAFGDYLLEYGKNNNLKIHVMHEDIFNCMHTI